MREIQISEDGLVTLVDDEDYEFLSKIQWRCIEPRKGSGKKYVQGIFNYQLTTMGRVILNAPKGIIVDHRNGDGLDNQRRNLRLATTQQNGFNKGKYRNNTSGFKGVCWSKKSKKWGASTKYSGKLIYLGLYDTPEEASLAYIAKTNELHGEFAYEHRA